MFFRIIGTLALLWNKQDYDGRCRTRQAGRNSLPRAYSDFFRTETLQLVTDSTSMVSFNKTGRIGFWIYLMLIGRSLKTDTVNHMKYTIVEMYVPFNNLVTTTPYFAMLKPLLLLVILSLLLYLLIILFQRLRLSVWLGVECECWWVQVSFGNYSILFSCI